MEEESTRGQQKLGEGENWELRLLAGSFSVLPRISRVPMKEVMGGVAVRGERGSRGDRGPSRAITQVTRDCASHRGEEGAKLTGR